MAPVMTNTATVTPRIFPALRLDFIPATDPAIEAKTKGTTMQNIILINTVPKGLSHPANSGSSQPIMHPAIMAPSKIARNL